MRDLLVKKFERAAQGMGFDAVPVDAVFTADDGLQVRAVLERHPVGGTRINRRDTLTAMSAARKTCPRVPGKRYAATHPHAHPAGRHNEEAPGASTPRAS